MSDLFPGKWISLLYRYGQIYITKELEPYNIGRGQSLFLLALYHKEGLLQEELSQFLKIDKGTTARAISKLEEAGYVRKEQNDKDLRSNQIFLTERGKEIRPHVFAALERWNKVISTGMSETEVETAINLLDKMAQNAVNYISKERNPER